MSSSTHNTNQSPLPLGGAGGGLDFESILINGINFGRGGERKRDDGKVKTKAKKKQYVTGAHGSGSARQKAKYREQRAKRHKK